MQELLEAQQAQDHNPARSTCTCGGLVPPASSVFRCSVKSEEEAWETVRVYRSVFMNVAGCTKKQSEEIIDIDSLEASSQTRIGVAGFNV